MSGFWWRQKVGRTSICGSLNYIQEIKQRVMSNDSDRISKVNILHTIISIYKTQY